MLSLLRKYLAINTAPPRPDYGAVVALFKHQAQLDGFLVRDVALPSGNPVVVITLAGSSQELSAIALNHHMDVVPADNVDSWVFPPFAATVHEGILYGRGTQDCKGLGVMQYAALCRIQERCQQPERTIHLLMVPDEECGGFKGTREFVEHPLFAQLNIGFVLDEGMPSGDPGELLIKVDERTPLQIRVTSTGAQAHASGLMHDNCMHHLAQFLADIVAFQREQQTLGAEEPGQHISMQITSVATNTTALNVIPSQASATIDARMPSHCSLAQGVALIERMLKCYPTLTYEILATSYERCKTTTLDAPLYRTLAQAVVQCGLQAKPLRFEATTDARFYSNRGIETIGCTPLTSVPNLHGTNEAIALTELEQGVAVLETFLVLFCCTYNKSKELI